MPFSQIIPPSPSPTESHLFKTFPEFLVVHAVIGLICSCYVASVVSESVRPHRRQPTRIPRPWDPPGKNTGVGCHFPLQRMKVKSASEVTQSCLTLSNPMDYRLPDSSVHGIFQARVQEWGAIAFSKRSQHFMANSWGNNGNSDILYFLELQITADGDCSHEIKRCLLLGRKTVTNLDDILKSRDITWPTNVHVVKAMVLPLVMYGCEMWTIKKAEHQRIEAFELSCWLRFSRVPWTGRRSSQ